MGLQLSRHVHRPDLYRGITLAIFHSVRITPVIGDKFIRHVRGLVQISAASFILSQGEYDLFQLPSSSSIF